MDVAQYLPMKAHRTKLLLLSVSWVALACVTLMRSSVGTPLNRPLSVTDSRPLEQSVVPAEPFAPEELPPLVEAPVAAEEPKSPVQPLEERGDAMLFESEALLGTPFGQDVVMPFD
jgi:hypothetical protein